MKPVVIYRLGSLGDTVVSLPCFHKIAERFPDRERVVLTNFPVSSKAAPVEAILGGSGLAHRFLSYPIGTRSPAALWRLSAELRRLRADTLVFLSEPRGLRSAWRDVAFFRLSGFRHILGAPLTSDLQSYHRDRASGQEEQECRRLARCLAALGEIDIEDPKMWDLHLTAQELAVGRAAIAPLESAPFLAFNMGGKDPTKDWGEANWRRLMESLATDLGHLGLAILGASEESRRAHAVSEIWPGAVIDFCGRLTPRQSAAVLTHAALFIGHDSGPLHLASASLCPWLGVFGAHNAPKRWHPVIGRGVALHDMRGVQAIEVEQVAAAARQLLSL
jgi:ADP-heptose:LPS heptosyltransferase